MSRFHEQYGQQAEMLVQLQEYFERTQTVLRQLADGEIQAAQIRVSEKGWDVGPVPDAQSEPTPIEHGKRSDAGPLP